MAREIMTNKWISVLDEYPDGKGEYMFVVRTNEPVDPYETICHLEQLELVSLTVTSWLKLPEPPVVPETPPKSKVTGKPPIITRDFDREYHCWECPTCGVSYDIFYEDHAYWSELRTEN